jgi:hypothetical protein
MTDAPQTPARKRRWLRFSAETSFVVLVVAIVTYGVIDFVNGAREAGRQDEIRAKVRAGRLDPEAGRGIMLDEEIEQFKASTAHP